MALKAPLPKSYQGNLCFYTSSCFATGTLVKMADGTNRPIEGLQKGDLVLVPANSSVAASSARIACVVTKSGVSTVQLPGASGLHITPYHPVRDDNGEWAFPADIIAAAAASDIDDRFDRHDDVTLNTTLSLVYNFVLESGHVVVVNGVEAVTLGHGFVDNDVLRHPYYGTDAILKDLKAHQGWENGRVHLG